MKKILAAFAILSLHCMARGEVTNNEQDTLMLTTDSKDSGSYLVCSSEKCRERAKLINESLDWSIKPCDNFYSFVCDRWNKTAKNLTPSEHYGIPSELQKGIPERMKHVIENMTIDDTDQNVAQKVGVLYKSCTEFPNQTNNADGWLHILENAGMPSWPLLPSDTNDVKEEDLGEILVNIVFLPYFYYSLRNQFPQMDDDHAIRYSGDNRKEVIEIAMKAMKPNISDEDLKNLSSAITDFDKKLSWGLVYFEIPNPENRSVRWLEEQFPNISFFSALQEKLRSVGITITENDTLMLLEDYFTDLKDLINDATPQLLYNYAGAKVMHSLTHSWKDLHALVTNGENRWSECLKLLRKELPEPLTYVYAKNTFGLEAKKKVEEIAHRVNATLVESIRNMATIQNTTKESLLKKVAAIKTRFGYSDNLFNMTVLEGLYSQVPYLSQNSSFLELLEKVSNNSQGKILRRFFNQDTANPIWIVRKGLTDCDHCSRKNHLEFPIDLFQPPFFEEGLPWSLNFGGFGAIFAHALIHHMHKEGGCWYPDQVNTCGLFDNDDDFCKNKSACFLQQYKTAMEPEFNELSKASVKVHSDEGDTKTAKDAEEYYKRQFEAVLRKHLDSDIADGSGLSLALSDYTQLLQDECGNIETRLEGLEQFSGLALFLTTRAMSLCGATTRPNLLWWLTSVMGHSPYHHRVNLPLQNLEAIATAFNCSKDSAMYKQEAERCSLW